MQHSGVGGLILWLPIGVAVWVLFGLSFVARGTRGQGAGQSRLMRRLFALTVAVLVLIWVVALVIAPRIG